MYPKPLVPPKKKRRIRHRLLIFSLVALLVALTYGTVAVTRPFAELKPERAASSLTITTPAAELPWPAYGQGAVGLLDGEIIASHGEQSPVAIASAAKVVTALVVLEKRPLPADAAGPTVTMTADDVALYNEYVAKQGSVTPVYAGQKLTERQLLQALLLPSANNIADSLAIWSYGSVKAYLTAANQYLKQQGLTDTTVAVDASGYSPASVSTARDLVKLGGLAMRNPALAQIVGQKSAVIPAVGTVHNYNTLLGSNGIIGIKTGNNDRNGGVFIGAAERVINGKKIVLITALSGAPTLSAVLRDSQSLLVAAGSTFADTTIIRKDAVLGTYRQANGKNLQAVAANDLNQTMLRGTSVRASVDLESISYNAHAGQKVGSLSVPTSDFATGKQVDIVLKQTPVKPDLWYRLTHP